MAMGPTDPTHYPGNGLPTHIDIVVAKNLGLQTELQTLNEGTTDHNPILLELGTVKKNKPQNPSLSIATKLKPINSNIFGYGKDCLLLSYVPKKNKNVLMLSTFLDDNTIDEETGENFKPQVILFYKTTKGAVDIVDQMKCNYIDSRISCR
ncbi:uncharacterized protein [Diabrotica undecimpunctata]|uniref:uncharacterized protein n=1 Tax=Diabrotica undecimpunctata TaxID=50387 RepID=UPI003B63D91A